LASPAIFARAAAAFSMANRQSTVMPESSRFFGFVITMYAGITHLLTCTVSTRMKTP